MRKTMLIVGWALTITIAFLPLGKIISWLLGYSFELTNYPVYAIVMTCLSLTLVSISLFTKNTIDNIVYSLITPFAFVNIVLLLFEGGKLWIVSVLAVLLVCCIYLTVKHGKPVALKVVVLVLSCLMVLPIGFLGLISLMFGDLAQNTVVSTIKSPNDKYYVEVIDSDQGALGGDTFVEFYENKGIRTFAFKVVKVPKRIYQGEWGAYKNMDIYWKNNHCLVINSSEYEVDSILG